MWAMAGYKIWWSQKAELDLWSNKHIRSQMHSGALLAGPTNEAQTLAALSLPCPHLV